MKGSSFILISALFTTTLLVRLDFNGLKCNNYLRKFGAVNSNYVGPTSLAYTGNIEFVTGTADVKVNLRYSDSLYNDAKYWGLTQEDGNTAEATCLDLKLWKFTSSNYTGGVQVTDLPFNATSELNKKPRSISFTINGAESPTRLAQTTNNNIMRPIMLLTSILLYILELSTKINAKIFFIIYIKKTILYIPTQF